MIIPQSSCLIYLRLGCLTNFRSKTVLSKIEFGSWWWNVNLKDSSLFSFLKNFEVHIQHTRQQNNFIWFIIGKSSKYSFISSTFLPPRSNSFSSGVNFLTGLLFKLQQNFTLFESLTESEIFEGLRLLRSVFYPKLLCAFPLIKRCRLFHWRGRGGSVICFSMRYIVLKLLAFTLMIPKFSHLWIFSHK